MPEPASQPSTAPASEVVSAEDVATLNRVTGWAFTQAQREQIAPVVTARRPSLKALRAATLTLADGSSPLVPMPHPQAPGAPKPFSTPTKPSMEYDGHPESIAFAGALEQARLLRAGKVTSVELTKMYLARLEKWGPSLRCVVTLMADRALAAASRADAEIAAGRIRSPLHGIPFGAKDLFSAKGAPTTWGVSPYKDRVIDEDATVIARLEDAGAILVAKLSLGELAMGDVWFGGLTRNPWNPETGSSGSSAGSASAVAAGLVSFALGTETLGSIVSPCCACGTTGLRPTLGLVPRTGAMALSWTMDKIGPITRRVEDAAAVLHVIQGADGHDPIASPSTFGWDGKTDLKGLRVGYDADVFAATQRRAPEAFAPYAEVLATLTKLGATPVPVKLPRARLGYPIAEILITVEGAASLSDLVLNNKLPDLAQQAPNSWPNSFRSAEAVPAPDYLRALRLREQVKSEFAPAFAEVDLYIAIPRAGSTLVTTNLTGHPTLVTRCGMSKNGKEPIMVEFVGRHHREDALVTVAAAFEAATQHHLQWPTLS
jgi:Asp-tRNA(Asn)/Glu-tRNA(Gln) amidotransferase A subunit family amidase